jgi:hypothetical protein
VLEGFNPLNQKQYEIKKSNIPVKSADNDEIKKLQNEIRELKKKLNEEDIANQFNAGLSEVEKKVYE